MKGFQKHSIDHEISLLQIKKVRYLLSRVVVQNERYDDWTNTLIELKRLFNEYCQRILTYHQREGVKVPHAWNAPAAQGNFLETLNMALNGLCFMCCED